jgi:hypothetical protein
MPVEVSVGAKEKQPTTRPLRMIRSREFPRLRVRQYPGLRGAMRMICGRFCGHCEDGCGLDGSGVGPTCGTLERHNRSVGTGMAVQRNEWPGSGRLEGVGLRGPRFWAGGKSRSLSHARACPGYADFMWVTACRPRVVRSAASRRSGMVRRMLKVRGREIP